MQKNKKKSPGRPKKEFVSKKTKTAPKSWPGRPRKDKKQSIATNHVSPAIKWFVKNSVDHSKRKDLIILMLFLLSFILFVVSLYFTFTKDKTAEGLQSELSEITNIEKENIDYGTVDTDSTQATETSGAINGLVEPIAQVAIQSLTTEQQMIVDFYIAINAIDTNTIYTLTDARLEESNVFKTYYNKGWLTKFSAIILEPKIVVTNIQEEPTNSTNENIKNFSYTLEYMLVSNQQKFTEERSTVLIKNGDVRRIGKLMCETKWCSTMPFFNPDKYK